MRYPSGLDFEALDGKPVFAAFGVVGPPEGTGQHVKLLARIARLVKETGALDEVLGAPDVDDRPERSWSAATSRAGLFRSLVPIRRRT